MSNIAVPSMYEEVHGYSNVRYCASWPLAWINSVKSAVTFKYHNKHWSWTMKSLILVVTIFAILISESSPFSFNNWLISCDSSVDCFNKFILARPNIRLRIVTTDIIDRFTEIKAKLYFSSIINTDNFLTSFMLVNILVQRLQFTETLILHLKIWNKTSQKYCPTTAKVQDSFEFL